MAEVGGPPLLRVGHERGEVLLQRVEIEGFELLGVIEVFVHRISARGIAVQDLQVQLIRPPPLVGLALGVRSVGERALGGDIRHYFSPFNTASVLYARTFLDARWLQLRTLLNSGDSPVSMLVPLRRGSPRVLGLTRRAETPVRDFGFVNLITVVVRRREARSRTNRAVDVDD